MSYHPFLPIKVTHRRSYMMACWLSLTHGPPRSYWDKSWIKSIFVFSLIDELKSWNAWVGLWVRLITNSFELMGWVIFYSFLNFLKIYARGEMSQRIKLNHVYWQESNLRLDSTNRCYPQLLQIIYSQHILK